MKVTVRLLSGADHLSQILTGFSISIFRSIKELPGFAAGTFDRDAAFRALIGKEPTVL